MKQVNEDVQFAQDEAHEAVSALEAEIIGAVERLAKLHQRVAKLHTQIDRLDRGDQDGEDYQRLFEIRMLSPVPEDMDADVLGTILHQGNIFGGEEGETCIAWSIGAVESRVQGIEDEIAKNPPPDNDWCVVGASPVETLGEVVKDLVVDGKVGVIDHGDRIEIVRGDVRFDEAVQS
jgi:hypothetical protein